eukprot:1574347-Rhodomonas_salina.3
MARCAASAPDIAPPSRVGCLPLPLSLVSHTRNSRSSPPGDRKTRVSTAHGTLDRTVGTVVPVHRSCEASDTACRQHTQSQSQTSVRASNGSRAWTHLACEHAADVPVHANDDRACLDIEPLDARTLGVRLCAGMPVQIGSETDQDDPSSVRLAFLEPREPVPGIRPPFLAPLARVLSAPDTAIQAHSLRELGTGTANDRLARAQNGTPTCAGSMARGCHVTRADRGQAW